MTVPDQAATPPPICAIGASAGGIDALQDFFASIPNTLGAAFIVIIHLAPDQPSHLDEILSLRTTMPVRQVETSTELQPNSVYLIPPDKELVINEREVAAHPFTEPRGRRTPIDTCFRSLAAGHGDCIAVLLSGTGTDGTLGVRAMKQAGGLVFVQDPGEAEYPMMPSAAIATGIVDFVAPVARLTARIAEVILGGPDLRVLNKDESEQEIRQIVDYLRGRTGQDFQHYKRATVTRRIARRMQATRQGDLNAYYRYLLATPDEANQLFADLLISVTMFFRDPATFVALAERAINPIFDRLQDHTPIRIWVAGCATGEEAYSIGILLIEEAQRRNVNPSIQIFASDLDEAALAMAREGSYPQTIESDVSEGRLRRFFVAEGQQYRVSKELRDLMLFASHNMLKDPPFIKLDLVACRNVLIYLERDMQRQLCTLFHYALKPHGFLFLGSAEAIDAASGLFDTVDRDARIYSTLVPEGKAIARLPQLERAHRFTQLEPKPASHLEQITGAGRQHVLALEQQAPPSVLVDAAGHILHLSPTVGRFFLPSEGPFTAELSAQVRPELRIDLKVALQRALENGEATLTPPIPVAFNGHHNVVAIQVAPVGPKDSGTGTRALVFFLDGGPTRPPVATNNEGDISRDEIRRLRQELTNAQQRLGTTLQEHNLASQELRAMNEELQSINEEYRSTAEELETSKEELQSMNEELQTVNAELRSKLETISTAHNDLQNLMDTTEIGTLFLDAHLRIKLFTPAVAKLFNITIADVGRVISDFTHRLVYEGLEDDATNVLRSLHSSEAEVMTRGGDWLTMRVRPYRTLDDRIEGVVVTFADITARKRAEDALAGEMRAMTRLQRLSTEMAEADQIEAPLTAILDAAIDLLEADFGKIRLYDDDTKTLRTAVHRGFEQPFLDRFAEIDASAGSPYGAAFARGQQIIIEDVEQQPTLAPILDQARAAGFHGFQATPLFTRAGKLVGVLATHFRQPRVFSDHDLRLIAICARQAADAINTYQLQQSVRASEARLRKVLETDAVGVLFFDGSGTLIDCNDAFLQMTGYTRAKVAAHELSWHIMTPPKGLPEGEAPMDILAATGRLVPFETEFLREDGTRRWMLITGRSVEKNLFAEYAIDITDRIRAQEERELLARELSHRVKNTLAVVQALAMQTSGDSVAAFREAFVGRLRALAETHTVLLDSNWQDANLKVLAEKAMAAYNSGSTNPVRIEGPATALNPKQALGVSLILHELATNATKYGALSVPEGLVHISWQTEAADGGKTLLRLTWREEGGPVVKAPEAGGFGSQLIVRACEYELDGTANLLYERKGVTAEIVFPLT